jgi:hypothetical protein
LAWAGPIAEGERHYHRLRGPSIIEYDNMVGDHLCTVWHQPASMFGNDLLRRHHREHG